MVPLRVIRLAPTAPKALQLPPINLRAVKHPLLGSTTLGISGCLVDSPAAQTDSTICGSSTRWPLNGPGSAVPRAQPVLPETTVPRELRLLPTCPARGGFPQPGAISTETSGCSAVKASTPPATARSATFGRTASTLPPIRETRQKLR